MFNRARSCWFHVAAYEIGETIAQDRLVGHAHVETEHGYLWEAGQAARERFPEWSKYTLVVYESECDIRPLIRW